MKEYTSMMNYFGLWIPIFSSHSKEDSIDFLLQIAGHFVFELRRLPKKLEP